MSKVSVTSRDPISGFQVEVAASAAKDKYLVNVTADGNFPFASFNQQEVTEGELPKAIQKAHDYIEGYKRREEDARKAVERWLS